MSALRFAALFGPKFLLSLLLAVTAIACSRQSVYENIQSDQKRECDQLLEHARKRCLEGYELDYEAYERERQKVLSE